MSSGKSARSSLFKSISKRGITKPDARGGRYRRDNLIKSPALGDVKEEIVEEEQRTEL